MEYTIIWIGEVFLGVATDQGRQIGLSLLEGQAIPAEFKEGDRVRIVNSPDALYTKGIKTENRGYYTVTHIPTGKTLTVWHKANEWRLEAECEACRKARAKGTPNLSCSSEPNKCRNSVEGKSCEVILKTCFRWVQRR
jgi:hypothetical protein